MSRRAAIWGAAALSLVLVLLLSAMLFQPALGSDGNSSSDGVITVDSSSDLPGDDDTWHKDEDEDEDRYEDDEDGEQDD